MGLENRILNNIDIKFAQADKPKPDCWFEFGTLWADVSDKDDVDRIKQAVLDKVNADCDVQVSNYTPRTESHGINMLSILWIK